MPNAPAESETEHRVSTGIPGLDNVLCGGLDSYRLYLVEGEPGTGKTTLALQFLLEGARRGESVLYVTLSESDRELRLVAKRQISSWGVGLPRRSPPRRGSHSFAPSNRAEHTSPASAERRVQASATCD
jgi:hypothetical protein